MLWNRSCPAVSQKSARHKTPATTTQPSAFCFPHNLKPRHKAWSTCSASQIRFHLTNLKHSRAKRLCKTRACSQLGLAMNCTDTEHRYKHIRTREVNSRYGL